MMMLEARRKNREEDSPPHSASATTGEMLDALARVGFPHLIRFDDGTWSASVKLPTPEGVTLEVKSGFKHPTHESALIQLIARLGSIQTVSSDVETALLAVRG